MRKLILIAIVAAAALQGYMKGSSSQAGSSPVPTFRSGSDVHPWSAFKCDGRTRCAQMTSCAEARFFLQHCPDATLDGERVGVPCAAQGCK